MPVCSQRWHDTHGGRSRSSVPQLPPFSAAHRITLYRSAPYVCRFRDLSSRFSISCTGLVRLRPRSCIDFTAAILCSENRCVGHLLIIVLSRCLRSRKSSSHIADRSGARRSCLGRACRSHFGAFGSFLLLYQVTPVTVDSPAGRPMRGTRFTPHFLHSDSARHDRIYLKPGRVAPVSDAFFGYARIARASAPRQRARSRGFACGGPLAINAIALPVLAHGGFFRTTKN